MAENLFRKEAISRLRSPEQLDVLLQLTRPWSWAALSILGAVLVIALVWGLLGSVPVQVQGMGVFLPAEASIYQALAPAGGLVREVGVAANRPVAKGETIAVIALPVDEVALQNAQRALQTAQRQYDAQKAFLDRDIARRRQVVAALNQTLQQKIGDSTSYLTYLQSLLADQAAEEKMGYLTRQQTEATRTGIFSAEQSIAQARDSMAQNDLSLIELENTAQQTLNGMENQVDRARDQVASASATLASEQTISAPVDGIVTEVDVKPGVLVQTGSQVALIEQRSDHLVVNALFSIADGKKLRRGLIADVSPLSVERDLYGSIRATVAGIGSFPESLEGVTARVGNATLAATLMQGGAPIGAVITLELDAATPSGLRWTSSRGPNVRLSAGENASVSVVVKEKRPIDLVIPLFDAWIY